MLEQRGKKTGTAGFLILTTLLCLCLFLNDVVEAKDEQSFSRRTPVVTAVEQYSPAVINISTDIYESRPANPFYGTYGDPFFDEFFNRFFTPSRPSQHHRKSLGSGLLLDRKGHILTNHHVILKASKIHITLASGKEYAAELIGSDPTSDLAVLKIEMEEKIDPIILGTSSDLMIGETVIAIGNPFGLSHTVTTGVISALNRTIQAGKQIFKDFIQTDASINPGNSGGPLLNIQGRLIGINTAIYSDAQGIGFAIPVDRVRRIIDDLIIYGEVQPAWFGLEVQGLTEGIKKYLDYKGPHGILIAEVYSGSPAAKAGLQLRDILLRADKTDLTSPADYGQVLRGTTINDKVAFRLFRKGKEVEITLKGAAIPLEMIDAFCLRSMGFQVKELSDGRIRRAGISGVVIKEIHRGSQAHRIGLEPGDVLLKINDRAVSGVKQFRKELSRLRSRSNITLQILRGRHLYYVTLNLRPS